MLIVFSGLPGSGKSTIAKQLAARIRAAYLRIDTIEQALLRAGTPSPIGAEGYAVALAIAEDTLRAGTPVVADAVNAAAISRDAWRDLATRLNVRLVPIGVRCSDTTEHRRRVETRSAEIDGHILPTWADVTAVRFEPFPAGTLLIDTAQESAADAVDRILSRLAPSAP
jgi:predicted kinase